MFYIRGLAIMLQNVGSIACQVLREDVWFSELVTNDTTPHVYRKVMLVVTFDRFVWIIMIS
jgi:hypothetical protein